MNLSRAVAFLPVVLAGAVVVLVTAVQGLWTDRWSNRDIAGELKTSAEILEEVFPTEVGPWRYVEEGGGLPPSSSRRPVRWAMSHASISIGTQARRLPLSSSVRPRMTPPATPRTAAILRQGM